MKKVFRITRDVVIALLIYFVAEAFLSRDLLPDNGAVAAPAFTLPTLAGAKISLREMQGRTTVVYFFAPWCNICRISMSNLESLHQAHPEYNILAVALSWDNVDTVRVFAHERGISFAVALGTQQQMSDFHVSGFPTYYVLDRRGRIVGRSMGYSSYLGLLRRAVLTSSTGPHAL